MLYKKTQWIDHVVDESLPKDHPDHIIQQGTPQSATNFNNMEDGILSGDVGFSVLTQQVLQNKRVLADLEGEIGQVSLTNTQRYPFNNSSATVNLEKTRDTLNYRVEIEIVASVGIVGDVIVYDKQLNGFKIRHTGSATSVTVKYYVQGGMYQ